MRGGPIRFTGGLRSSKFWVSRAAKQNVVLFCLFVFVQFVFVLIERPYNFGPLEGRAKVKGAFR